MIFFSTNKINILLLFFALALPLTASALPFSLDAVVPGCGDGIKAGIEQCDTSDYGGASCVSLGFSGGTLSCTLSCTINTSACSSGSGGGDIIPPAISVLAPADNSTGVSATTTLSVDFTEPVTIQTGNIKIKKISDGSTVQTIAVTSGQVVLSPSSRMTITLSTALADSTSYYVELDSGIVKDLAGNAFAGISDSSAWNFITGADITPPQISGVSASPGISSANLAWTTNESAVSSFFWGTTTNYLSGSGAELFSSLGHTTTISGLLPGTLYYFSIKARDAAGNEGTAASSFTTLPADTSPPANPSGFTATAGASSIALSWTNPSSPDFDVVKIMRSTSSYPANQNDGTLVYQGSAEETFDASVSLDVRYYYTIFARDTSLNYSSGALATAIVNSISIITPPPTEPPPPPPVQPGGEGVPVSTSTPPIVLPPPEVGSSTPPITTSRALLVFTDFDFFERGNTEKKIIPNDNEVAIHDKNELKISLSFGKVPQGAKLFIASIKNPITGKISTYLLNKNKLGTGFETIVSSAPKGKYPINIIIYSSHNQTLSDVDGLITVSSSPVVPISSFIPQALTGLTENITPSVENIAPVAVPVGVAVGVSQAVILASNIGSFYDLYLLFLKFLGLLTGFFRKKKPQSWGVVYDSVTKQPIDPAYVVVSSMGEGGKKSAITDLDGRYGFLLSPGAYSLVANKTHYKFPSDQLRGRTQDELYDNLYFGTPFELVENQVVRYNVPLDPVEFDWNEFTKNKDKIFSMYSRKQKWRVRVFNALFYSGLILSAYSTILRPTTLNAAILSVYGIIILFQALWKYGHKVTTLRRQNGEPIPFALISATMPKIGVLRKKVVSDEFGRFYLLIEPGVYDITVQEKQPDGSYAAVYSQNNVPVKKGVFDGDIIVGG